MVLLNFAMGFGGENSFWSMKSSLFTRRKIILAIIAGLVIFAVYQGFFKEEKPEYSLASATLGNVFQEVSETGQVQAGEEVKLAFKNGGRIERIYWKEYKEQIKNQGETKEICFNGYLSFDEFFGYISNKYNF